LYAETPLAVKLSDPTSWPNSISAAMFSISGSSAPSEHLAAVVDDCWKYENVAPMSNRCVVSSTENCKRSAAAASVVILFLAAWHPIQLSVPTVSVARPVSGNLVVLFAYKYLGSTGNWLAGSKISLDSRYGSSS
jgi:hypothetical protein